MFFLHRNEFDCFLSQAIRKVFALWSIIQLWIAVGGKILSGTIWASSFPTTLIDIKSVVFRPGTFASKVPFTRKKRFVTGRYAVDRLGTDALILDDGFQHLALARDLDLVLFSAHKLLGNGRVIPGGELREPLSSLNRADAFIISGISHESAPEVEKFIAFLKQKFPQKPVFTGSYLTEEKIQRLDQGKIESQPISGLTGKPLFGFCGIAQPRSFKSTLQNEKLNITDFASYPDHYVYCRSEIKSLTEQAKKSGADGLITTAKDFVKLKEILLPGFPVYVLSVKLQMTLEFDAYLINHFVDLSR